MDAKFRKDIQILIVDEQALAQSYLKHSLERLGFSTVQVTDRASQALQLCSQIEFDIVILALNLQQGKDGFQLYEEIKTRRLQPAHTAFLFVSADTDPALVHSVLELQPDDFLVKPYTIADLQQRLDRLIRRKLALRRIFEWLDNQQLAKALQQVDEELATNPSPRLAPTLLKLKGDLLMLQQQFVEAATFYRQVLQVQPFAWAEIGLLRALQELQQEDELRQRLSFLVNRPDTRLPALDIQAELAFLHQQPDKALDDLKLASELAPRNLYRQQKLFQLSRLNHDYEQQYKTARDLVKFAKHSMYDQPDLYLNLARACIDYAVSVDEDQQTNRLGRQANDALNQLKTNFPDVDTKTQQTVVQARLYYMQAQKDKAKQVLEELPNHDVSIDKLEDALDRAKALHEVGLVQLSRQWFDRIVEFCHDQAADPYLSSYLQQEQQERAELSTAPRELNNIAVRHYQQGNWQLALTAFEHAFRLLPKNVGIALNLWQSLLTAPEGAVTQRDRLQLELQCERLIDQAILSAEQQQRVAKLRKQYRSKASA